jgi:hypothetical protein
MAESFVCTLKAESWSAAWGVLDQTGSEDGDLGVAGDLLQQWPALAFVVGLAEYLGLRGG